MAHFKKGDKFAMVKKQKDSGRIIETIKTAYTR